MPNMRSVLVNDKSNKLPGALIAPGVYHDFNGSYYILVQVGRKWLHAVNSSGGLVRLPLDAGLVPAFLGGGPYPLDRAVALFLKKELTDGAKEALEEIRSGIVRKS